MDFDFSKPVENLESVPSQFRVLYKEKDGGGGFELKGDDNVKGAVEAIVGLNTALRAARAEAKAAKGSRVDLAPLAEFGDNPAAIAEAVKGKLDQLTADLAKGKDAKLNLDKIKAELAEAHSKDLKTKEKRIEALTGQLYTHLVESTAAQAIAEAKGVPVLLLPFVKNRVKVVEEEGKLKVFVVDDAGDVRYSGVTGQPMSIKELIGEMKIDKQYGRLFESDAASGAGTPPNRQVVNRGAINKENMSAVDKIRAGLAKGQAIKGK